MEATHCRPTRRVVFPSLPPFPTLAAGMADNTRCRPFSSWCVAPSCVSQRVMPLLRNGHRTKTSGGCIDFASHQTSKYGRHSQGSDLANALDQTRHLQMVESPDHPHPMLDLRGEATYTRSNPVWMRHRW